MIRAYAVNKAWVIGFLMDISGAMLMLRALSQAPVSEFIMFITSDRVTFLFGITISIYENGKARISIF